MHKNVPNFSRSRAKPRLQRKPLSSRLDKWRSGEGGIKWQCVRCGGLKERIAVQKAKVVQPSVTSVEPKGRRRDVCGKTWELSASQRARLFNGALYTKDLREVGFFIACLLNAMVHFQRYKKDHINSLIQHYLCWFAHF